MKNNSDQLDNPTKILQYILLKYGESIIQDPKRFQSIFNDIRKTRFEGELKKFKQSISEEIPSKLLKEKNQIPYNILAPQLAKRLQDNLGMQKEVAEWVVESWAVALGIISEKSLKINLEQRNDQPSNTKIISQPITPQFPSSSQNLPSISLPKKSPAKKNILKNNYYGLVIVIALIILISIIYSFYVNTGSKTVIPTSVSPTITTTSGSIVSPTRNPTATPLEQKPTSVPTSAQTISPKYKVGDIIRGGQSIIIIDYNTWTDRYQYDKIFQNNDGSWGNRIYPDYIWEARGTIEQNYPSLLAHLDPSKIITKFRDKESYQNWLDQTKPGF